MTVNHRALNGVKPRVILRLLPMSHVVVKVARNAGIIALFIVAAMLGILLVAVTSRCE